MRKIFLLIVCCVMSFVITTVQAQEKQVRTIGLGMEAVVNYNVDYSSPQFISFTGLSPYRSYSLKCSPYTQTVFPSDVNIVIWNGTSTLSTTFGGTTGDSLEIYNLVPYLNTYGSYAIDYQLTAGSIFSQKGVCVFG